MREDTCTALPPWLRRFDSREPGAPPTKRCPSHPRAAVRTVRAPSPPHATPHASSNPPKDNVDAQEVLLVPHTHNQTHGLVSGRPVLAGSYVLQALGPHHASPPAPDAPDDGPFDDKVGSAPSTLFPVLCLVVAVGASRHYGLIPFAGHGRLAMAIARVGSAHPKPKVRPGRSRNPLGKRAVAPPEPPSPDCHRDGRVESEVSSQRHDERPHPAAG
jgi:hypothetical protein